MTIGEHSTYVYNIHIYTEQSTWNKFIYISTDNELSHRKCWQTWMRCELVSVIVCDQGVRHIRHHPLSHIITSCHTGDAGEASISDVDKKCVLRCWIIPPTGKMSGTWLLWLLCSAAAENRALCSPGKSVLELLQGRVKEILVTVSESSWCVWVWSEQLMFFW